MDKGERAARRLRDIESVQATLDQLGSIQNITLTHLARNKKVLFVEGADDWRTLRRFARKLGLQELASGTGITQLESGGFSTWTRIRDFAWGARKMMGKALKVGAVLDRDYAPNEEMEKVRAELEKEIAFVHILEQKEMENYLLNPDVIERALESAVADRSRRQTEYSPSLPAPNCRELLSEITDEMRTKCLGQWISRRSKYLNTTGKDQATLTSEAMESLDPLWQNLDQRLRIVKGKDVLKALRDKIQAACGVSLTTTKIVDAFRVSEIPSELCDLLHRLERYRLEKL